MYPELPKNRLIVNNIDLTEEYGMILLDGYKNDPPAVKTQEIDIPGRDGKLDLSELLLGRPSYNDRTLEFSFVCINVQDIEAKKTEISSLLNGKSYDFRMTMDPLYTYHGRFAVSNFAHTIYDVGEVLTFNLKATANPFKTRSYGYSIPAVGGVVTNIDVGGVSVAPLIVSGGNIVVEFNGKTYNIDSPTYKNENLKLPIGFTAVYICSVPVYNTKWSDMETTTWADFKSKRLCDWYKANGTVDQSIARPVSITFDRSDI